MRDSSCEADGWRGNHTGANVKTHKLKVKNGMNICAFRDF